MRRAVHAARAARHLPVRPASFNAALAAMDAIETSERLRVAALVGGLRSWAKAQGIVYDDDELQKLSRPASPNPHLSLIHI